MKSWILYIHINKTNKKKYVGITSRKPNLRWQNGKGYMKNEHFYRAIQKYGWDGFEHIILFSGLTEEEACLYEKQLIAILHTQDYLYGYNIEEGGQTPKMAESTKKKLSKAKKGRKMAEETKKKLSEIMKTKPSPNKGRKLSDEWKRNIGNASRGKKRPEETVYKMSIHSSTAKKVVCENRIFNHILECANYYNVPADTMRKWVLGKTYMPESFYKKGLRLYGKDYFYEESIKSTKVYCDGNIYNSASECARYYNVNIYTLGAWLRGANNMPKYFKSKNLHRIEEKIFKINYKGDINYA